MAAPIPYIPIYPAELLADTAHLNALEFGAYMQLIFNYWTRGKALINVNERLANVARVSNEEWLNIKFKIEEFFQIEGNEWVHPRIEQQLAFARSKSEKASSAGKTSAQRKLNRRSIEAQQTFNELPANAERTLNHTNTNTNIDLNKNAREGTIDVVKDLNLENVYQGRGWWDEFKTRYPPCRHKQKSEGNGRALFGQIVVSDEIFGAVLSGLEKHIHATEMYEKNGYLPTEWPSMYRFLSEKRWMHEVETDEEIIAKRPPLSAEKRKVEQQLLEQKKAEEGKIAADKHKVEAPQREKDAAEVRAICEQHWECHYPNVWPWRAECEKLDKIAKIPSGLGLECRIRDGDNYHASEISKYREVIEGIDWEAIQID